MRQGDQRLPRHGDDRTAFDRAFGRARTIEQHRDGEVALLVARVAIKPLARLAAGAAVGGGAHAGVEIDLDALHLPRQPFAARPQSLELPAHGLDAPTRRRVKLQAVRRLGGDIFQHPRLIGRSSAARFQSHSG